MSIIKVQGLSKDYGPIRAVNDLSFEVEQGDVYGFLGQNGAGKSTTIRMLLTLISPSSGEIEIFGKALHRHRREVLRRIGAVIERPDLYKYLTAFENLRLFAEISGRRVDRKRMMEQLEMVGLADRAFSKVRTYSQGMKQRLGIAVALVHDPDLILLDEPTNGLDPQGIADMRKLIIHLSRELHKTVLVSSHLLSEVEQIATRMIIIHKGKKIVEGPVTELFDRTRMIVQLQTDDDDGALERLRETRWGPNLQQRRKEGLLLQLRQDDIPHLVQDLVRLGVNVRALQPRHSLENYFLTLTSADV